MENKRKINLNSIVLFICGLLMLSSCQATPENNAAIAKKDGALIDQIEETQPVVENTLISDNYKYEVSYKSGVKLVVDAPIRNYKNSGTPVITLSQNPFSDGDELEKIADLFAPNQIIYDYAEKSTKTQIESEILHYKGLIYKLEADLPVFPEDTEPIPQDQKASVKRSFEDMIAYYEQEYKTAPDDELIAATFTLKDTEMGNQQANMYTRIDDALYEFDFVNSIWGSSFYLNTFNASVDANNIEYFTPEQLVDDETFRGDEGLVFNYVLGMGIDYMKLNTICKNDQEYTYTYVREYAGLEETFIPMGFTIEDIDMEESVYMSLWRPEYVSISVKNSKVTKVVWENKSKIDEVDNKNVKTLSWEEIKEIFVAQTERMFNTEDIKAFFPENPQININRIEYGLTKILMPDSSKTYKLVPSYSFLGYEIHTAAKNEVCFLTINAIDGTIINRQVMY